MSGMQGAAKTDLPDPFMAAVKTAGAQVEAARKADRDRAEQQRKDEARNAVKAVLVLPDGTALNLKDVGLEPVEASLPVWAIGDLGLAHSPGKDGPPVRLVRKVDREWTDLGAVTDLADVARLLVGTLI